MAEPTGEQCNRCGEVGNEVASVCRACGKRYVPIISHTQIVVLALAVLAAALLIGFYVQDQAAQRRADNNVCALLDDC